MEKYSKPSLTFPDQVALLASRGLIIENKEDAERFLSQVSYYRLSAYCVPAAYIYLYTQYLRPPRKVME